VSLVSPITLLAPVLGVVFGVTLWGDELTARIIIGGLMTLAGVLVIALRKPPSPDPAAEA
jgi:O-acetylserine/cysteine efflux transporter